MSRIYRVLKTVKAGPESDYVASPTECTTLTEAKRVADRAVNSGVWTEVTIETQETRSKDRRIVWHWPEESTIS